MLLSAWRYSPESHLNCVDSRDHDSFTHYLLIQDLLSTCSTIISKSLHVSLHSTSILQCICHYVSTIQHICQPIDENDQHSTQKEILYAMIPFLINCEDVCHHVLIVRQCVVLVLWHDDLFLVRINRLIF